MMAAQYASSSVLASGKWVKINIKQEGMQLLTPAALKGMGFADPSKVHVYGYGGYRLSESKLQQQPDDLPMQPVVRLADGSIIFFGAGLTEWTTSSNSFGYKHFNNFYSTTAPYFLSDREATDPQPEPYSTTIAEQATPVTTFTQLLLHENDLASHKTTGADLFGEDFRSQSKRFFSFEIIDPAGSEISYNMIVASDISGATGRMSVSADNKQLGAINIRVKSSSDAFCTLSRGTFKAPMPADGKATLELDYSGSGVNQMIRLDFIEASYERQLRLSGGVLAFCHQSRRGSEVIEVEGCSQSTLVWDVTDPAYPRPVNYTLSGSRARFAPSVAGLRKYVAFNPEAVKLTPASLGKVDNQDLHAEPVPSMVIITLDAYKEQAERLANFHREADGMTVLVVNPEKVYNEFSSGKPDATAFRKMLKMFYDRGKTGEGALENCLLFGRPSYDHRLITDAVKLSSYPRLLTWESWYKSEAVPDKQSLTIMESDSYCTDNYFAALEDEPQDFNFVNARMSIGVGRMPVKSVAEARSSVDKIIAYASGDDLGAWRSNVMLIADDADNGSHLRQMEVLHDFMVDEANGNGADFVCERLYLDSYPIGAGGSSKEFPQAKERMFKKLDEGVGFLAYIGHANTTSWTHENLMTYSDITSVSYKRLPVILHISCEFVRMDDDGESGAETMWLNPTSGAIAFIAAHRKVYIGKNEYLARAVGQSYFARDAEGGPLRLGTAWRNTLNTLTSSTYNSADGGQKHRFSLIGDPALHVVSPARKVKLLTLDDTDMTALTDKSDLPVVPAQSKLRVTGAVTLPSGTVDESFNGTVTATLFDAERVIETYGHPSETGKDDGKVSIYNDRKNRLAQASFPVVDGKWDATLYLPDDIENNYSPALLALYASSTDGREAIGHDSHFIVYGWDDSTEADTEGPEIEYARLGGSHFRPGDVIGSTTTFQAKVRDDSGINISSAGIGKQMMLVLDGKKVYDDLSDYFTTDPDDPTGGTVDYPLESLIEGSHELVFQLFDNAGNSSRTAIPFTVGGPGLIPDIDLRTDANPASTTANIYITTASQPHTALVEVFDMAGRRVWSMAPEHPSQSMAVQWDLCTTSGQRVPRGIYLYRATVTTADGTEHRRTRKLAVTE